MKMLATFFVTLLSAGVCFAGAGQICIQGGTIVDGTGVSPITGKVIVLDGDSIQSLADAATWKRPAGAIVIDATGMVVAPGFIDTHSHAESKPELLATAATHLRQGITTALVGQDGGSEWPIGGFLERVEKSGTALNIATMAGFGAIRARVMGEDFGRAARPEEIRTMCAMLQEAMEAGAFGLSTGLEYEPDSYATTEEIVAVAAVAGAHGGFYLSHVRDEGNGAIESFRELIEIARRARLPAQISHIKLAAPGSWGKVADVTRILDAAEKDGLRVTADCYPYTFWHSSMRAMVLSRQYENRADVEKGLMDSGGPENITLAQYAPDRSLEGKTFAEIAHAKGIDAVTLMIELMKATPPKMRDGAWVDEDEEVLGNAMRDEDIRALYADPRVMVSSDGGIEDRHPRCAGAFPRFLGRYVRDQKLMSLEEGIRKMTSLPASIMGLADRGRLAPGFKADIVIFDPAKIIDRSTVADPMAAPDGIRYVFVNGKAAIDNGVLVANQPPSGRVIRRPAPHGPSALQQLVSKSLFHFMRAVLRR